ncbi:hypothetical protein JNJ66_05295 [Candidatus Saccharibacteria bacterium]|nr:hypothetical protein [Candidatus Saccharibacteria bacterium]
MGRTPSPATPASGYLLASILMLTTAMTILSFAIFDTANIARRALETELYKRLANDAAQSGIEYAYNRVAASYTYSGSAAPTDCANTSPTLAPYVLTEPGYCTTFRVQEVSEGRFVSTGYVIIKQGSATRRIAQNQYVAFIDAATPTGITNTSSLTRTGRLQVSTGGNSAWGTGPYTPLDSFTPRPRTLLIATVVVDEDCDASHSFDSSASTVTLSGGGLSWSTVEGRGVSTENAPCDVAVKAFAAFVGATAPNNLQVTVDAGSARVWAYTVYVHEYKNFDPDGAIVSPKSSFYSATSDATFSFALDSTPAAGDIKVGAAAMQAQDPGDTGISGWRTRTDWTTVNESTDMVTFGATSQINVAPGQLTPRVEFGTTTLTNPPQDVAMIGYIIKQGQGGNSSLPSGSNDIWYAGNNTSYAREGLSSLIHNNYLYSIGGCNSAQASTASISYSPLNANGTTSAATATFGLPFASCHGAAAVYNGRFYAGGGNNRANIYYSTPQANGEMPSSWNISPATSTVTNLYGATMEAYNGWLYLIGGLYSVNGNSTNNTAVTRYAINSGTGALSGETSQNNWFNGEDPYCLDSAIVNGRMYVLTFNKLLRATINADGSLGAFTAYPIPANRDCGRLAMTNSYAYVLGGSVSRSIYYAPIDSGTGAIGTWSNAIYSLPSKREAGAAHAYNGFLYYISGTDVSAHTTTGSQVWFSALQP